MAFLAILGLLFGGIKIVASICWLIVKISLKILWVIVQEMWNLAGIASEAITETIFYIFALLGEVITCIIDRSGRKFTITSNINKEFIQRRRVFLSKIIKPFTSFQLKKE